MDAELCRAIARARMTPWWVERQQTEPDLTETFTNVALEARTLERMPLRMQEFLKLCDRSFQIAKQLGVTEYTDAAARMRVIQKLIEEMPSATEKPPMPISNMARFPDVDWLPSDQRRVIGSADGIPLVLVGTEQGTDVPMVAKADDPDDPDEQLQAMPLYELLKFSQGAVQIEEEI